MACCSGLEAFPSTISCGLPLAVTLTLDAYPAPDWLGQCLLRGPTSLDISAEAHGCAQRFYASAATTAKWTPGHYWYSLRVRRGDDIHQVEQGDIEITPDFASLPAGYDGRSPFEVALEAIDAVMAKRATQDQMRYRINNRELWRTPVADLIALRSYFAARVRHAKQKGRGSFGRNIVVRFTS